MPINVERGPARSDGKGRIRITVFIGKVLKRHRLEIHVKENCWDSVHKRVKVGDPMHAVFNKAIEKALEQARTLELEHPEYSAVQLVEAMENKPSAGRSFYEVARERLEELRPKLGYNTYRQRVSALKIIEGLEPGLSVQDFTVKVLERMESKLLAAGLGRNTVTFKLRRLRTMWLDAARDMNLASPWERVKLKTKPSMVKGLMPADVERLRVCDLSAFPEVVQFARDVFVLQFYLCGMRFSDLCRLNAENVTSELHYQMHKSSKVIRWPIHANARSIMDRRKGDGGLVLPLLKPADLVTDEATCRAVDRANALVNPALKVACAAAGIPPVTTHWARHSNNVKAILSGVGNRALQDMNGHSSSRTTDEYAKALVGTMHLEAFEKMHG
jgi:integrase